MKKHTPPSPTQPDSRLGPTGSSGSFAFWVWFRKNGGDWRKANHTATSEQHANRIMADFCAQDQQNGRTDLEYVVSDVLPKKQ